MDAGRTGAAMEQRRHERGGGSANGAAAAGGGRRRRACDWGEAGVRGDWAREEKLGLGSRGGLFWS
jgi:hypothetical protein